MTENFGRSGKSFKDLRDYLSPPTAADKKRGLLDMFRRKQRSQRVS